ncbi:MAG TPA: YkgJ family cysteine cluster protein [Draconibacterium sp.]|nr:YkgJ family cysteine cluster protein [Draconibacterium sp.]
MKSQKKGYLKLRDQVDQLSAQLEKIHRSHLSCKMGCDLCCMDYSIFPVEFYSIADQLSEQNLELDLQTAKDNESCVFLKDHKCSIYTERPVICRTHGLPLLYVNENEEWELSACELNFTEFDTEEFNTENTFPQDRFNSELFMLNKEFIKNFEEQKYGEFDLIPIRELLKYIKNKKQ